MICFSLTISRCILSPLKGHSGFVFPFVVFPFPAKVMKSPLFVLLLSLILVLAWCSHVLGAPTMDPKVRSGRHRRDEPAPLPFFKVPPEVSKVSPYATFHAIGSHFASRIQAYAAQSKLLHDRLIPWYEANANNRLIVDNMIVVNRRAFPLYYEEIRGYSDGSRLPLLHVLLLNFASEIDAIIDKDVEMARQSDTSCSDIFLLDPQKKQVALGHNEDADADIKDFAYMVEIEYPTYAFVGYCYPGYLPGNTFGFTSNHLVITTNAEFPKGIFESGGLARSFLNRHLYSAKSTREAVKMLEYFLTPLVTGFAVNLVSLNNLTDVLNVEVAPGFMSVKYVNTTYYGHFNQYDHLKVPEHYDPSSVHREARYKQMTPVTSSKDIHTILGDTQDREYPIYRDGLTGPDQDVKTTATAFYDLLNRRLTVYTSNPKTNPVPQLEFDMYSQPVSSAN